MNFFDIIYPMLFVLLLVAIGLLLPPTPVGGQEMNEASEVLAWLEILSPRPDSVLPGDEELEISLLIDGATDLYYRVLIDSLDITDECDVSSEYIFYLSSQPWPPGTYRLRVLGISDGDTLLSRDWNFTIASPQGSGSSMDTHKIAWPADLGKAGDHPWEGSVSLGCQYADCDRDTAGLGLAYPVGLRPTGEISLYGPVFGGTINGSLSYDPSYDHLPHGLIQFSGRKIEISLGEFLPEISVLTFSQSLPLGILGRWHDNRIVLDLAACRTVPSDTMMRIFSQYLLGGRLGFSLHPNLLGGLGWLRGFDDPHSLPDSVRLQITTTFHTDTIFGISDTVITADTIHPLKNSILWLWGQGKWHQLDLSFEMGRSTTVMDKSTDLRGSGYLISFGSSNHPLSFLISYIFTTAGFRSFGNPYWETGQSRTTARMGWNNTPRFNLTAEGNFFSQHLDSSSVIGYGMALGLGHRSTNNFGQGLKLKVERRPYRGYSYHLRSLSAQVTGSALGLQTSLSYSIAQSVSVNSSRAHNIGLDLSYKILDRFLSAAMSYFYSHTKNIDEGSALICHNWRLSLSGEISSHLFYNFQTRINGNYSSSADTPSSRQTVWQMKMGYRF